MRKRLATLALGLGLTVLPAFGATASAQTPPDPAAPNCHGKTIGALHDVAEEMFGVRGMGQIAKELGVSVKDIQEAIRAFCATA
jgi:hypothetical protein